MTGRRSLQAKGWLIVRVAEGGFAPMMSSWAEKVVLPDIQATRSGSATWVEVKRKNKHGVLKKIGRIGEWTTGFDRHSYAHYMRIEEVTGFPVYVVFGHEETNEVRAMRLRPPDAPSTGDGQEMVCWYYADIPLLCSLTEMREVCLFGPSAVRTAPLFAPQTEPEPYVDPSWTLCPECNKPIPAGGGSVSRGERMHFWCAVDGGEVTDA